MSVREQFLDREMAYKESVSLALTHRHRGVASMCPCAQIIARDIKNRMDELRREYRNESQ